MAVLANLTVDSNLPVKSPKTPNYSWLLTFTPIFMVQQPQFTKVYPLCFSIIFSRKITSIRWQWHAPPAWALLGSPPAPPAAAPCGPPAAPTREGGESVIFGCCGYV